MLENGAEVIIHDPIVSCDDIRKVIRKIIIKEILKVCKNKPISFEVFADDYENILRQALKIKSWGKNVFVKIPVENSKGMFMGKAINELCKNNIKINIICYINFI